MQATNFEQILGLTDKEQEVYKTLTQEPKSIARIQKETSLPRMTVHYALERFLERGLVKRKKKDKRFWYIKVPTEEIIRNLLPTEGNKMQEIKIPASKATDLAVHRGFEGIYSMYERITRESKEKRLYTIQTTHSTEIIFNTFSQKQLDSIHLLMKKNEIIVEDIVEADFFDPIHSQYGDGFNEVVQTLLDRLTVTYVLPKNFIAFETDMVIINNTVIFIDWDEQVAIEVKTDQIVKMCKSFYELMKLHAEPMRFKSLAGKYI